MFFHPSRKKEVGKKREIQKDNKTNRLRIGIKGLKKKTHQLFQRWHETVILFNVQNLRSFD